MVSCLEVFALVASGLPKKTELNRIDSSRRILNPRIAVPEGVIPLPMGRAGVSLELQPYRL